MTKATDPVGVDELKKEVIEPASTLLAIQHVHGDQVRKESLATFGALVDAHMIATGVLGAALLRVDGKFTESTPEAVRRNAIFADFIVGLSLCESAICEGGYLQASALLRQQVESLAALKEISTGTRKDGKTPNVRVLDASISRLYGDLSAAAHFSEHDLVNSAIQLRRTFDDVPRPTHGARHYPAFDADLGRRQYGLHIYLMLKLIEQLSIDFERYSF